MPHIPLIVVHGDHRSVGRQIGEACRPALEQAVDLEHFGAPRGGIGLDELLRRAATYREITARAFPFLVDELDGAAEGARVDPLKLFAASVEELWDELPSPVGQADASGRTAGGCTDVLVAGTGTAGGHVLVAHNNDLAASSEEDIVAVERHVPGEPVVFSLGIGPWISVGWNSAGISLTGNEVSPNDERSGIPRLLLVRAQLRATSLAEATALALHPERASAYNTVFADAAGSCLNVEASATNAHVSGPDGRHAIVHTNHYVSASMLAYEGDPEYASKSAKRFERATALLGALEPEKTDAASLRAILSDHENAPDSICRHATDASDTKTVFWCVADVTDGLVSYGKGNPCDSDAATHRFGDPAAT